MFHLLWWAITLPIAIICFVAQLLLWPVALLLAGIWLVGRLVRR